MTDEQYNLLLHRILKNSTDFQYETMKVRFEVNALSLFVLDVAEELGLDKQKLEAKLAQHRKDAERICFEFPPPEPPGGAGDSTSG